ncbi:hypothetical protein IFM89_010971, partial [Coptis chinensis]
NINCFSSIIEKPLQGKCFRIGDKKLITLFDICFPSQGLSDLDMDKNRTSESSPRGVLDNCTRSLESETSSSTANTSDCEAQPNRKNVSHWRSFLHLLKSPVKKKLKEVYNDSGHERKSQARSRPKRNAPSYKDPLADSKLEMIKNIKAQRMETETKKIEAMEWAKLNMAARHAKEIGELYETEQDLLQAIAYLERAADLFSSEEVTTSANQCKQKVAQLAAQLEHKLIVNPSILGVMEQYHIKPCQSIVASSGYPHRQKHVLKGLRCLILKCQACSAYAKAVQIYEEIVRHSLNNNLLKYNVKGYLLNAGLCQLCKGDAIAIPNALEKYQDLDPTFSGTREYKFLACYTPLQTLQLSHTLGEISLQWNSPLPSPELSLPGCALHPHGQQCPHVPQSPHGQHQHCPHARAQDPPDPQPQR